MTKLRVLDLFSGIGGFSLGLERTGGFETVAFCEIEDYPRRVLAKHWPDVPCYEDVRNVTEERLTADGIAVDVITGGFPCQDISVAGRQVGLGEGTRSGLWSEIARLIGELRPRYVIVENVANLLSGPSEKRGGWFGRILGDLAEIGYDAEWHCLQADYVGRPTLRDRVWIVAFPNSKRLEREWQDFTFSRYMERSPLFSSEAPPTQICSAIRCPSRAKSIGVDNGFSDWMGEWRGYGNAVVPQIPEMIGYAILEAEKFND